MMFFVAKIFITVVITYAAIRMSGIGIQWLKAFFDELSPKRKE